MYDIESKLVSLESLKNYNVKTIFKIYIGLKEAILERLKTSNQNKLEIEPFISNSISISYNFKQIKGYKVMCISKTKKDTIR